MRAAYAEVKRQQGDWNPQTPPDRQDLGGGQGLVLPEDEGWMLQRKDAERRRDTQRP